MKYDIKVLSKFGIDVMIKAGLDEKEAGLFIDSLTFADLRGIGSHGLARLITYSKRVESGIVAKNVVPKILSDSGAAITVDGLNGIGVSIGIQVMDMCIERAKKYGICSATVENGNHFGTGAYFTMHAARNNMIGFAICNSEAAVVPDGGAKAMLGTNPLSVAVPAKRHPAMVLDMATSVVARGKVLLAEKEHKAIPDSWAVDANGVPTTNPTRALDGAMLPFGGPKGYAISLLIDILCSSLGGALDCRKTSNFRNDFENPQNVGYFIGALDISKFVQFDEFTERVDAMFDEFKACPTAPGVKEVMIPGEIEHLNYLKNLDGGIELSDLLVAELVSLAEKYGVQHPFKI